MSSIASKRKITIEWGLKNTAYVNIIPITPAAAKPVEDSAHLSSRILEEERHDMFTLPAFEYQEQRVEFTGLLQIYEHPNVRML